MKKISTILLFLLGIISFWGSAAFSDRIKDLTSLAGVRSNQLVGYGVVVGLAGTGDGNTGITLQSMQSLVCLLYTSPSPRDLSTSRMPSSA